MKKVLMTISSFGVNIIIYIAVILVIYRAGAFAYDFSYQVFGSPVVSEYSTETINVVVEPGDSVKTVANKLESKSLIENKMAFELKAKLSKAALMPGTYKLAQNMSADQMIALMSDQKNSIVSQPTADDLAGESSTQETEAGEEGQDNPEGEE